jgi:hypothetical protein
MGTPRVSWPLRREQSLAVLVVGLFSAGLCFVPPTIFESGDYVLYWKPTLHFLAESVYAGTLPLWNPYIGLGRPFLADMQNIVCYPPAYLICVGQTLGVFLLVWLHGLVAVFGMRRLGQALGAGRWQSYFMAFTFLASGALTARYVAGQITYVWGLCFLPWLFYYALRTEEPWQAARLARYASCLALQFLCGHPQVFWFSALGQAVFILARSFQPPWRQAVPDAARSLGQFGVACAWCTGLIATLLLPMLELVKQSNRSASSPEFANAFHLDLQHLRSLFGPLQCGAIWETNLFVGSAVVATGIMGLCLVRERNVRGLLGVLILAFLLVLGNQTPFSAIFYKWLPGYAGFRFHSRAAVLIVLALICASGIWLSRPHPRLRWFWIWLFGIPVPYVLILLVSLQTLDLLQGTWFIKQAITWSCALDLDAPMDASFEQSFVAELRKADLIKPSLAPPRVSVRPTFVPADYGMIHHYSHFDAGCSLFLRRPWDYLHGKLGVVPNPGRGELPPQIYKVAPFPYPDLNLAATFYPPSREFILATNPAPRAFLVHAAEVVTNYATILARLARGHDIHRSALLERPLHQPLPADGSLPGTATIISRFEPNWLLVDADAPTNALLVVAEAWYPGWHAQIDGRPAACVPANLWMRAVPLPPGRHQVRLCFRQNLLLPGFVISLAGLGLVLLTVIRSGTSASAIPPVAVSGPSVAALTQRHQRRSARRPGARAAPQPALSPFAGASPRYRLPLRVLAMAAALAGAWLLAYLEISQLGNFEVIESDAGARAHCHIAEALFLQGQNAQAAAHCDEAVRLAQRACEMTGYVEPVFLGTLALAFSDAGRLDEALAAATRGRAIALANGRGVEAAEAVLKLVERYNALMRQQTPDRK